MSRNPIITARLADMHHGLKDFEFQIKRIQNVAKHEDQLDVADAQLMDTFMTNLWELAKAMEQPVKTEASDLMGLPQDLTKIVSIQVQTTRLTGAGVEMVSFKEQHNKPTHWSIYKRDAAGMAHWIEDIDLRGAQANVIYGQVMVKAAKYSQMYQAFIEQPF